jgi:hypothetical protein
MKSVCSLLKEILQYDSMANILAAVPNEAVEANQGIKLR